MGDLYSIDGKKLTQKDRESPYLDLDEGEGETLRLFRIPVVVLAQGQVDQIVDQTASKILSEVLPLLHEQLGLPLEVGNAE